jgi:hypothetical protein
MTADTSSVSRLTRYTPSIAVIAVIAVAGSVWANGNRQIAPGTVRIDVAALISSTEIANLPVLNVEQPF